MRVIQGRLSGFLKSLNICVQMQDRAIPTTSQTKMCGSAYKMLLLVNVLAKFIPEHNKERVPYIHLPTRSFSRQAGISWTIISVSMMTWQCSQQKQRKPTSFPFRLSHLIVDFSKLGKKAIGLGVFQGPFHVPFFDLGCGKRPFLSDQNPRINTH